MMDWDEAMELIEKVLDTLIEVGNGATDEDLHTATDNLFKAQFILSHIQEEDKDYKKDLTVNDNRGDYNTGTGNSGSYNNGDYNSGHSNTGNGNSGSYNSGDFNSGNDNSGHFNRGHFNTGNFNCGDYNTGSGNSGCFNTIDAKIYLFNKPSDWTHEDWLYSAARNILANMTKENATKWWCRLSDKEKATIKAIPNFDAEIFKEITGIDVNE